MRVAIPIEAIKKLGRDETIFLSILQDVLGGGFEGHAREIEELTGFNYSKLLRVRKTLKTKGLIKEKRVGSPPKLKIILTPEGRSLLKNGEGND